MKEDILFAVDPNTEEVIVSGSSKGSNKINFIERISREKSEKLYYAVLTLTSVAKDPKFDVAIYKATDKVCQMIYKNHKEDV